MLIGFLPTHGQVGILAPILLVVLRFAQGVGVGGEWGGAVLLTSEFATPETRGFWASAAQVGPPLGNVMANGVLGGLAAAPQRRGVPSRGAGGWPSSCPPCSWRSACWIRTRLEETPVFREMQARGDPPTAPITEVLRTDPAAHRGHPRPRRPGRALRDVRGVRAHLRDETLGLSREGRHRVMIGSAWQVGSSRSPAASPTASTVAWSTASARSVEPSGRVFLAMRGRPSRSLVGVVVGLFFHSFMYGPQAAFVSEQFHARLRYTGSSLAYTFAGIIGGAVAPLAFTYCLAKAGTGYVIAAYIVVACGDAGRPAARSGRRRRRRG